MINGIVGNTATIAVTPDGSTCSDPLGPSSANIQTGANKGSIRYANVQLGHISGDATPDGGTATFASTPFTNDGATLSGLPAAGSCLLASGNLNSTAPASQLTLLDAGPSLQVSGPSGTGQLAKSNGTYAGVLNPVQAGTYTVTGPGGKDVGAFSASVTVPGGGSFNTNPFTPGSPLPIIWNATDPNAIMSLTGTSFTSGGLISIFTCTGNASAGTMTVPAYITAAMTNGTGVLLFLQNSPPVSFSASGLDQGFLSYTLGVATPTFSVGNPVKE